MLVANAPAHAGLTLTPAGIADGFTLTTYASGGMTNNYTFLAAAPLPSGNLAVVDFANGFLRTYPDVNGQTPGSALSSQALGGVVNIANAGGNTYAAVRGGGLFQVSSSLGLTPVSVPGFTFQNGLAGNPITGHLLAAGTGSGGFGIYDFTPGAGITPTLINANGYDGVSVSPDGTTVYGAVAGSVLGFNIVTHAQVFNFALHGGAGPDGTGVISGGTFNGFVISNNNDGTVSLINPTGTMETIIASGGSRGDFTSPDTNNGTLLLSEFDTMFRLNAPGGTFGGPGAVIPEPTSFALFGFMAVGGLIYRWRRRKSAAA
jgi:hypothetical protein